MIVIVIDFCSTGFLIVQGHDKIHVLHVITVIGHTF